MNPKQCAAERAVSYLKDGMTVGLGTGSTAAFAIHALGKRFQTKPFALRCVATSQESEDLARTYGIPFVTLAEVTTGIDVTIDGADEVDPEFRLIKGGGGALVREKIVAQATRSEIIIVDPSKVKPALGARLLPVAILPFAWDWTQARLQEAFGVPAPRRAAPDGTPFVSDDGLFVLDMAFGAPLPSPETLEARLKAIVGVVESGLFVGLCQRLIIGHEDGRVEEKTSSA